VAVFVSGSDETSGPDNRSLLHYAGFVMKEEDWSQFFAPAWASRVLEGPPELPYLHMTEIRSKAWREEHGISERDADNRVHEAVLVIKTMGSMWPVRSTMDAGRFRDIAGARDMRIETGGRRKFEPDYLAFLGYVYLVLLYVRDNHADAEKVDFVVEIKKGITENLHGFHNEMRAVLKEMGEPRLESLLGDIIPGGKERVPLQAADVLCWHTQRASRPQCTATDRRRYRAMALGRGWSYDWRNRAIEQLADATSRGILDEARK
jgi:hypothetical protein